ncbi:unnamed protein product, partial [marine sediment metagenome]
WKFPLYWTAWVAGTAFIAGGIALIIWIFNVNREAWDGPEGK